MEKSIEHIFELRNELHFIQQNKVLSFTGYPTFDVSV